MLSMTVPISSLLAASALGCSCAASSPPPPPRLWSCLERGGRRGAVLLGDSGSWRLGGRLEAAVSWPPLLLLPTRARISLASVYSCSRLLSVSARPS